MMRAPLRLRGLWAAFCAAAFVAVPALAGQAPAGQNEFVPINQLPPADQLPAAPYLIAAYAFVWVAVFWYLWLIWRRLSKVENEIHAFERRSGGGSASR